MSDDSFFDPIDSELRRRFDAATPRTPGDPDAVLDDLRPQLRRARTRHRAALGGMAAGVVAIVAVAGFALIGGASNPNVNTPPATHSTVPEPDVTTPTTPTVPTSVDDGGSLQAQQDQTEADLQAESDRIGGLLETGTTTAPAAAQTQAFSSAGGSITVTLANGSLSLTSTSPAAGQYAQVTKNESDIVEVEFYARPDFSGGRTSRIRVEVVNGALVRTD
jgi:hypothetical protein